MITMVGWADGGKIVCLHAQTKRTSFCMDMSPEQGRELANDLLRVVEIAERERASREGSE